MTGLEPGTPAWARVMTASKVAAALGVSPWDSPRSIWHKMRGDVPWDDGRNVDEKSRGHYLEPGILAWWRSQHPEYSRARAQYLAVRDDLPWAAATPDLRVRGAVVDAKTSRDAREDDGWGLPGTDEVPTYYVVSSTWQMHLARVPRCYLALLTSRLELREYVIDYDPALAADLVDLAHGFYLSLGDGSPPPLDDSVATWDALRRLHPDIDRGAEVEVPAGLAWSVSDAQGAFDRAEADLRLAKSALLELMGRAQYAVRDGTRLARRQAHRTGVSLRVLATSPSQL